jgi:putative intracellular protease/amidase
MNVLCLLPAADYDPTEAATSWHALAQAGHRVSFATPSGQPAPADLRLTDTGFGLFDSVFMTRKPDLQLYRQMAASAAFQAPLSYAQVDAADFGALLIPGGHAAGMRSMLDSTQAQAICTHFFTADKPVAAVCHGVLLPARSIDPASGRSVLHGRRTTALPATLELGAWALTAAWLGRYYRTYPQTVQSEVTAALARPGDFDAGPLFPVRDSAGNHRPGFIVRDGRYLSARWPGDCHRFAAAFVDMVAEIA